jgi:hypothetical protein
MEPWGFEGIASPLALVKTRIERELFAEFFASRGHRVPFLLCFTISL